MNCIKLLLAMLIVILPQASSGIASESVIFMENFDSTPTGSLPPGWEIVYSGAGTQYQIVTDTYSASSPKSLQLLGSYNWGANVKKAFTSKADLLGFEAYMRTEGESGSIQFFNYNVGTWGTGYGGVGFSNGYIYAGSNAGQTNLIPYQKNTWYKIRLVIDRKTNTYKVWINDALAGENLITKDSYEIDSLGFNSAWDANGKSHKFYFDDVKVFTVSASAAPTPASPLTPTRTPATQTPSIPTASITVDGNQDDWNGIKPIMTDPEGDGANVQGSDLKALYAYKDSSFLYLMLEVYNNPDGTRERVQYIFEISNTVDSPFLKWDYQPGGDAQGGTWLWNLTEYDTRVNYKNPNPYGLTMPIPGAEAMGRTVFEMKVPLFLIGNPENMIIRARTVAGEDKWADDMPSAKFIANPSLIVLKKQTPTPSSTPFVIINNPKDKETVSWRYLVEGSSSATPDSGLNLYVLVWNIESNGPWWVQSTSTFSDGSFQSNAYFGRDPKIFPEDKGSAYKLVAIITKQKLEGQTFKELPDYVAKIKEITVTRESDTTVGVLESKEYSNQFSEGLNYVVFPLLVSLGALGIVLFFDIRQKNKRLKDDLKIRYWIGYYSFLSGHFVTGTIFAIISYTVFIKELPTSFDAGKFFFTIPIFYLSLSSFILIIGLILLKPIIKLNTLHFLISLLMGIFLIFIVITDSQKSPPAIFPVLLLISSGISIWYDRVAISRQESQESLEKSVEKSILAPDIKRGYTVLPNNDIKFGIRVSNPTGYTITDVDTILDYTEELFKLKKSKIQRIGNIPPETARTATYILKPLGCIHNENINAIISYTDATGKKHALHMRPKEVHCVCPFLKEKPLSEGEYSRLASSSEFVQEGISFKGIGVEELSKFMGETCRHMLYKVKEYDFDGKKVIYLAGESIGEKAYYLLTAVIQDYKGLTQVVLRAHSDKKYGLNGFMNEMADSIRHLVSSVQSAKEIGIIENTQVINIIDSVVQRTSFNTNEGGKAQVNIKDSMVRRSNIGASARKCPDCGREVEANEKFCLECGAKLNQ